MTRNWTDEPDSGPNREPAHLTGATRADRIAPYVYVPKCLVAVGPRHMCQLEEGHEGAHVFPPVVPAQ